MPFPFVIGSVRSGTTLVRLMLNSHPQLAIPPETYFPVELWQYRQRYVCASGFDMQLLTEDLLFNPHFPDFRRDWGLDLEYVREELPRRHATDYPEAMRRVYELYAEQHGKPHYGNKTPWFVRKVDLLADLFPEAVFIHLIRDGRDVVMSMLDQSWGPSRLPDAAALWKRLVMEGRCAGQRLGPERYCEVRYEDLVASPGSTLDRLCGWIGLEYSARMLRYHEDALDHMPARVRHLNGSLTRPPVTGLRDWRREMQRSDVATFEAVAGDLLGELGYGSMFPAPPLTARARAFLGAGISRAQSGKREVHLYAKKFVSRIRRARRGRSAAGSK